MVLQDMNELSYREKQILKLISQGLNSKEIGDRLGLAHGTVCFYRKTILSKTGSKNIMSVVIRALQQRVIPLDALLTT